MARFFEFEDAHGRDVLVNVDLVTVVRALDGDAGACRLYFSEKDDYVTVKQPLDKLKQRLWHKST